MQTGTAALNEWLDHLFSFLKYFMPNIQVEKTAIVPLILGLLRQEISFICQVPHESDKK